MEVTFNLFATKIRVYTLARIRPWLAQSCEGKTFDPAFASLGFLYRKNCLFFNIYKVAIYVVF